MNLKDYFQTKPGAAKSLAVAIGIDQSFLSQIASHARPASPERCVLIEKHTGGQVTRKDLRPNDWQLIWPELLGKRSKQAA